MQGLHSVFNTILVIRTVIGLKVKDGIVLAVENLVHSKLLVPGANRRIQTIDRHIGLARSHTPYVPYFLDVLSRLRRVFLLMAGTSQILLEMRLLAIANRTIRRQR